MNFDIVVVGGGLVGAALAVALRRTHLKVALIETAAPVMPLGVFLRSLSNGCCWHQQTGLFHSILTDAQPVIEPGRISLADSGAGGALKILKWDQIPQKGR